MMDGDSPSRRPPEDWGELAFDDGRGEGRYVFSPSIVMLSQPLDSAAEAIRGLRTHVMAQHVHQGRRALAVCAASAEVGCSFVAANLATAMSQIGVKTLLLDCDLRRPSLEELIRPPHAVDGLQQCLASEEADFSAFIETDVLPNLSVMYAGGMTPNAQELLAKERFEALMDFCLRDFDATIVDTPPANTCSDARRVATVAGYALVVARRNRTFISDVKTLLDQLRGDHARVVGTVLNEA